MLSVPRLRPCVLSIKAMKGLKGSSGQGGSAEARAASVRVSGFPCFYLTFEEVLVKASHGGQASTQTAGCLQYVSAGRRVFLKTRFTINDQRFLACIQIRIYLVLDTMTLIHHLGVLSKALVSDDYDGWSLFCIHLIVSTQRDIPRSPEDREIAGGKSTSPTCYSRKSTRLVQATPEL